MEATENHIEPVGLALVADDDATFRQLLARRARRMGLTVIEAENGTEALQAVAANSFDVLVLDVYMPGATGLEVFEAARRLQPDIQAIVMTGSASVETAVEALRQGVYDYMTKPLESLAAYEVSLTRALEHRHLIRENKRLFNEVQRLAITDPLTGLFNRHKLTEALETEFERAARYGRPVSLIMMDLDDLKVVNDTHGHVGGDAVLQQVADAIRGRVRRLDLPTRYGGDEFLVLLPETTLEDAHGVAERIGFEVRKIRAGKLAVTASIGVVGWSPAHQTSKEFLQAADRALYEAKRRGRGAIVVGPLERVPAR
ncbi:MAG TPA: diguanylate cyclase [Anaerolineales bacterium]|nr:diguanylate cyclase [Anaerolineales bacterium]